MMIAIVLLCVAVIMLGAGIGSRLGMIAAFCAAAALVLTLWPHH